MLLYNIHTHTLHSHDSNADPQEICRQAIDSGLFGFAITDHLDCEYYENPITEKRIDDSFETAMRLKEEYRGRLLVSASVEMGDGLFCPDLQHRMTEKHPWDVILLSVHAVHYPGWEMPFSTIDFSDKDEKFIDGYLTSYFNDLIESVNTFDYDVLSHLTVPLRYIVKKYGKKADIQRYYPAIEKILKTVIAQDKALEINTSGYSAGDEFLMPDTEILRLYLSLGGKKLVLGSDAHTPDRIANGLKETADLLHDYGVYSLGYYSHRKYTEYFTGGTEK